MNIRVLKSLLTLVRVHDDANAEVCDAVSDALRVAGSMSDHLKCQGWDASTFAVLVALNQEDGLSPSVLADRIGVTRARMTDLLDRLEYVSGCLTRSVNQQDLRGIRVHLTEIGRLSVAATLPGFAALTAIPSGATS